MRLFLSASIRGGRQLLENYQLILTLLEGQGHEVMNPHVADRDVEAKEVSMSEEQIYSRDMDALEISQALIAEVSVASTGVGYEICHAIGKGIPVLCVHRSGSNVSAMIRGNPRIIIKEYGNENELYHILNKFIGI